MKIYAVYATSSDSEYLLGYATGDMQDIKAYFDDQKAYGLRVECVTDKVLNIPAGYWEKKAYYLKKKAYYQAVLRGIDKELQIDKG